MMSQTISASFFIFRQTLERKLKIFAKCDPKIPPIPPVCPTCYRTLRPMATAQVQCFGCNRKFTPRGLSQHISKTRDPCCRGGSAVTLQMPLMSTSIPHTAFPPALDSNRVPQGSGRISPDNLGMHNYDLGGYNDEMGECDGMQPSGPERASPNGLGTDLGMHNDSLGGHDDEMDGHGGVQSADGELSVTHAMT